MSSTARFAFFGCLLVSLFAPRIAAAGKLPDRQTPPDRRQVACPWTPPDVDTLDIPQAQLDAASSDSDDDSDDDDDNTPAAGDSGSSAGPGFLAPRSGCVLIDGEVDAGIQSATVKTEPTQLTSGSKQTAIQSQSNAKLGLTHYSQTEFGDLVTRVNFQVDQTNSLTLPYAYVSLGHGTIGLQTSFYDDWQASEFSFRALASVQSPFLAAYVFHPTNSSKLSLSLEDPAFRRVTFIGYGPVQYPDAISRFRYFAGNWQFIVNTALHQTTLQSPDLTSAVTGLPSNTRISSFWGGGDPGLCQICVFQ